MRTRITSFSSRASVTFFWAFILVLLMGACGGGSGGGSGSDEASAAQTWGLSTRSEVWVDQTPRVMAILESAQTCLAMNVFFEIQGPAAKFPDGISVEKVALAKNGTTYWSRVLSVSDTKLVGTVVTDEQNNNVQVEVLQGYARDCEIPELQVGDTVEVSLHLQGPLGSAIVRSSTVFKEVS